MEAKYCPKCKQTKNATLFWKCPTRGDGLRAFCSSCTREYNRSYYKKYYKENRIRFLNYAKNSQSKFKDKNVIRRKTHKLIKSKKIIKSGFPICFLINSK